MRLISFAAAAALCLVTTAQATTSAIPCQCRDTNGNLHEVGTQMCLQVDGRAFMALCDMSLNVTIWRDTGDACPTG
ncbi:hypothetical protein [Jannaschia ovalis]|uniref:Cysteine rich repeat-containing protein n=1 Tax=Jannaschia ovalis TaxID=3038773 RepID=A0ABY8LCG5_9RHOB|nr:hypothetical protein [Jannaschia sp. GRR-S6-38]WGH79012.1 hypothetical protein P8627_01770 [Jannaschia sp. GRR-S6-38]